MEQIEKPNPLVEKAKDAKKSLLGAQSKIALVIEESDAMAKEMRAAAKRLAHIAEQFGADLKLEMPCWRSESGKPEIRSVKKHLLQVSQALQNAAV